MKIVLQISIVCFTCLLFTFSALAQNNTTSTSKVGHMNSQTFLEGLPEWQTAKKGFDTYMGMKKKMLEDMQMAVQTKAIDYQKRKEAGELSPAAEQKLVQEIQTQQADFEKAQQAAQADVDKKEAELTEPIRKKIQEALNTVARENNYTQIFDTSLGYVLYEDPTGDITPLVRAKLGLAASSGVSGNR